MEAVKDGEVTVAPGADQATKTAAVQAYVDHLLTGGVTAVVTYDLAREMLVIHTDHNSIYAVGYKELVSFTDISGHADLQ